MTCPNCKCYVLNSWKRCEYCGAFLDTGKTKTVSISAYYNENQNLNRKRLQQQNYYNRNTQNNDAQYIYRSADRYNHYSDENFISDESYEYQPSSNTVCAILLTIIVLVLFILVFIII